MPDPTPPPAPEPAEPEPIVYEDHGVTPMEAARRATAGSALPGRPWGLPKLTARYDALLIALILLAGIVVYFNSFTGGLLAESRQFLQDDPRIRDLDHIEDVFGKNYGYPTVTYDGLYRPLTTLSFLFNYTILGNGTDITGYHAVNWALHALNAILLFYLVAVVFRSTRAAFAAAMLFICHPANTEAVTNIMGRADLLVSLLVLVGLFAHLGQIAHAHRRGIKWMMRLTLWGAFFLALLSKESGVILLPLVMLFDWIFDWRRYTGERWRDFLENCLRKFRSNWLPMLGVLLVYAGMRTVVLSRLEPRLVSFVDNPLVEAGALGRLLTGCKLFLKSLYVLAFPRTLSVDYSYKNVLPIDVSFHQPDDWFGVVALLLLGGILYAVWHTHRRQRPMAFWAAFFLVTLAPAVSVFGLCGAIFSERALYLPSACICALFGLIVHLGTRTIIAPWWAYKGELPPFVDVSETGLAQEALDANYVHKLRVRGRAGWFLYGLIIVLVTGAFGWRTISRNAEWASELSLWRSAAVTCPDSAKVHKQLAWACYQAAPDGSRIGESIEEGEKALIIQPDYEEALAELGHNYGVKADLLAARDRATGQPVSAATREAYAKAAQTLQHAASLNHASSDNRLKRLRERSWAGDFKLVLGNHLIYIDLGTVHAQLGQFTPALDAFAEAARIRPADPTAHEGMGEALANVGRLDDAAVQLLQALMLAPGPRTWNALQLVYQKLAPNQAAIARDAQGQMRINPSIPIVQGHLQSAFQKLVAALLDTNQRDLARQLATAAVDQYGMPIADFGDLVRREVQREKMLTR